jgi:hypothetical protein
MRFVVECGCGERYHAEDRHVGHAIKCPKCHHAILVVKPPTSSSVVNKSPLEYFGPGDRIGTASGFSFLRLWIIPILGLVALAVGITLTINKQREPKGIASSSSVALNQSQPSGGNTPATGQAASQQTVPPNHTSVARTSTTTNNYNESTSRWGDGGGGSSIGDTSLDAYVVPSNSSPPVSTPATAPTPPAVRYESGTNLITPQNTDGRGELRISNGTGSDAIAKLVDNASTKTCRLVYVQAGDAVMIKNIGPGDYVLKFCLGRNYDRDGEKFLEGQSYYKFDDTFDFQEHRTSDGIRWRNYEVTLNKVINGNASASPISALDFEDR